MVEFQVVKEVCRTYPERVMVSNFISYTYSPQLNTTANALFINWSLSPSIISVHRETFFFLACKNQQQGPTPQLLNPPEGAGSAPQLRKFRNAENNPRYFPALGAIAIQTDDRMGGPKGRNSSLLRNPSCPTLGGIYLPPNPCHLEIVSRRIPTVSSVLNFSQ